MGSLYSTARILLVRAATRPVRRLVRWGQQYLLGADGATIHQPFTLLPPPLDKPVSSQSTDGQDNVKLHGAVEKDGRIPTTCGRHHSTTQLLQTLQARLQMAKPCAEITGPGRPLRRTAAHQAPGPPPSRLPSSMHTATPRHRKPRRYNQGCREGGRGKRGSGPIVHN